MPMALNPLYYLMTLPYFFLIYLMLPVVDGRSIRQKTIRAGIIYFVLALCAALYLENTSGSFTYILGMYGFFLTLYFVAPVASFIMIWYFVILRNEYSKGELEDSERNAAIVLFSLWILSVGFYLLFLFSW